MSGKFLLDTNIIIALFTGDASIQKNLALASKVFIPVIVLGELYYGARKSGQMEKNLARIEEFEASISVITCDTSTARVYGLIKDQLRKKGRPIPENDIWVAAVARQKGLVLVTRDAHFFEIENLKIENW
ncbi:twitching motility protein PilT [Peptococcaceae bacterium SCADC1_2_3]|jgi:tRNA(fMet)-specific endonuclease VapC|nr:twitching motility protein PilT [Peptococcaceae bacterium SCADC1_2_3]HBQ28335.1 type II toxin-antitoxin system VapC family toxin [Desulfotomaculum sp.]KFI35087.1 twitching motility protein PilT [Peptococcaceae bacterium SCADC1_2_3]KFI36800.1 twitching motility protein PilT [Peptococcaceae bacterium SCADC1_2_3]KFI38026.1 twitching motility protein PilT [Peptococcaceae bacterium SCADC1_2_3]